MSRWRKNLFSKTPAALDGNGTLQANYRSNAANELAPKMRALLTKTSGHGGSPLMNVFVMSAYAAASHPGSTACIAVFTDAQVLEPDFNPHQALTPAERAAFADRWARRLKALRGAKVFVADVGRGTRMTVDQLGNVRSALEAVLSRVGASLAAFDVRLAPGTDC